MTNTVVRDADGVRALSFDPNWSTTVGNAAYCPDFSGVLTLEKDGHAVSSLNLSDCLVKNGN